MKLKMQANCKETCRFIHAATCKRKRRSATWSAVLGLSERNRKLISWICACTGSVAPVFMSIIYYLHNFWKMFSSSFCLFMLFPVADFNELLSSFQIGTDTSCYGVSLVRQYSSFQLYGRRKITRTKISTLFASCQKTSYFWNGTTVLRI